MSDWIGHLIFAATVGLFLKTERKSVLYLGALLPDIASKFHLLSIFLPLDKQFWDAMTYPSHTFLGIILLSVGVGICFAALYRFDWVKSSMLVLIGCVSHLFLDLFNLHYASLRGTLFFPSLLNLEIGPLLPHEYLWFWVVLIPLYFICRFIVARIPILSTTARS